MCFCILFCLCSCLSLFPSFTRFPSKNCKFGTLSLFPFVSFCMCVCFSLPALSHLQFRSVSFHSLSFYPFHSLSRSFFSLRKFTFLLFHSKTLTTKPVFFILSHVVSPNTSHTAVSCPCAAENFLKLHTVTSVSLSNIHDLGPNH